jgi:hypothetical protein
MKPPVIFAAGERRFSRHYAKTDAIIIARFSPAVNVTFAKNAKCNTYRKIFQLKNIQTFTP